MAAPQTIKSLPPLVPGERLDQKTFHARYEAMPPHVKAELIDGVVYIDGVVDMPSPLKAYHGRPHADSMGWMTVYKAATPVVDVFDNTTSGRHGPRP